jgi:glycerophosphoryl diester phosphodiesterase
MDQPRQKACRRALAGRRNPRPVLALFAVLAVFGTESHAERAKANIAHRGASAYAPEHTLAAYRLAIEQGADFVEQDLAITRDGALICLHDDTLERTTDVASVFPRRFSTASASGSSVRRWLANDFTLAEIRSLDAGRWFQTRFARERVPTWQEAVDLVRGKAGLYPELKSPDLYAARGIDMVRLFVTAVKDAGLDRAESLAITPLIVQSFDEKTVRRLATELPQVPRVLLMGELPGGRVTDERLREIASFATGISPDKRLVDADLVRRAKAAGLTVTAYTFRSRNTGQFRNVAEEMTHFLYTMGLDALFTDNPDQFPRQP